MKPLEPPDIHHLRAAEGWLELGNPLEAKQELEQVAPQLRAHPDFLKLSWFVQVAEKQWDLAQELADRLARIFPNEAEWHINQANTAYWSGHPGEARDLALAALVQFPQNPSLHYNVACYECQLKHFPEAQEWLDKAFALDERLKAVAPEDPDLKPLWQSLSPTSPP